MAIVIAVMLSGCKVDKAVAHQQLDAIEGRTVALYESFVGRLDERSVSETEALYDAMATIVEDHRVLRGQVSLVRKSFNTHVKNRRSSDEWNRIKIRIAISQMRDHFSNVRRAIGGGK